MNALRALSTLLLLGALTGCSCGQGGLRDSAARLTLSWQGFQPGCLKVSVEDLSNSALRSEQTLQGSGRSGERVVAIFRGEGWSDRLRVTATAQEKDCSGATVASQTQEVSLVRGEIAGLSTALVAADVDEDGWVAAAGGGTDCDDALVQVHPGAAETCDYLDNNCDGEQDEGFGVGLVCPAGNGCPGARVCAADGSWTCSSENLTWYPDSDGDGRGQQDGTGIVSSACGGPSGMWAPNALDCDDTRANVYADAPELCDGRDNSCEGATDEGFNLNAVCTGEGSCAGSTACEVDGGTRCDSPAPTVGYPDVDLDGHGAADAGTLALCGAPTAGQSSTNDDCRDSLATVYPGAPELCDSYDNDCDGTVDEDLGLTTCTAAGNCSGTERCTPEGAVFCDFSGMPVTYFPDGDRDGRGQADAGVLFCSAPPAGRVLDGGDCDDGDPFTYLAATEICDRKDNDCDLIVDESGCPSGSDGGWAALTVGGSGNDWQTTSAYERASLWIAGTSQGMRSQFAGSGFGTGFDGWCAGDNWTASWSSPTNGRAYFGGCAQNAQVLADGGFGCTQGKLAVLDVLSFTCGANKNVGSAQVEGLVGVDDSGTLRLFGLLADGDTFEWNGTASNPSAMNSLSGVKLSDIHGLDVASVYAVGTTTAPPAQPRVYQLKASNGSWTSQAVENLAGLPAGAGLHALWVVRADLIYAVGDAGLVLKYDGAAWSIVPGPPGAGVLTSVRAFGTSAVYVTSGSDIYRYNGTIWELLYRHESLLLHDLTGVAPDALWGVGDDGLVVRWP
ncbi:MAG: putative metal-binding motif-containing protein [Myxococcota bacterium]|nr:putative metal-binding motif-containing protein [Myxococcota bacterium]